MKPIEHVLLHPICVLSHLMCANTVAKRLLFIEHTEVADKFITSENPDLKRIFIIMGSFKLKRVKLIIKLSEI